MHLIIGALLPGVVACVRHVSLIALLAFLMLFVTMGCQTPSTPDAEITQERFGTLPDGRVAQLYTLSADGEIEVQITNYGGIVTSLRVPDDQGDMGDVVLGFDSLDKYLEGHPYFGAIIGRYANRIDGGVFTLDGNRYELTQNRGDTHLHGGVEGFDQTLWTATSFVDGDGAHLELKYVSPDGEQGYPGRLTATVTYTVTPDRRVQIDYRATTNKRTIVNLTNHSYFNLAGLGGPDILDHRMLINAEAFTPMDSSLIPTGEIRSVEDTPLDFRRATPIGARINNDSRQLRLAGGYDHNFVLDKPEAGVLSLAARVWEPTSNRLMKVRTTQPGVQFYTGNFLDGSLTAKDGVVYGHRQGFCLETQHFPDSPHHDHFPSTVLGPDETYDHTTVYAFGIRSR